MPQVNKPAVTEGSSAGGLNFRNFRKSKNVKKHKCVQLSVRPILGLLGFLTVHKQWDSTVYTGLIVQYSLTHHPGCIQYKIHHTCYKYNSQRRYTVYFASD